MSRGVLIDFDHTSLNRVSFTRGIRLLPILPFSTAKHNVAGKRVAVDVV